MKNINAIFDVGSNNGIDGINYAVFNPKCTIYAFEPNPFLRSTIINNKKKVENRLNYKIQNFKLVEKAVSDFNGRDNFYIANEDLCSSLLRYNFVSVKKKIIFVPKFFNFEKKTHVGLGLSDFLITKKRKKVLKYSFLLTNLVKRGFLLGFFVEAFKVGS